MSEKIELNWVSSFWRRVGAFFIDSLILGIVGFILGTILESTFVLIGGWGRFIGFGIALFYFGSMNSKLFDGQTLGKKLLKLRVVNFENQTITLERSILRSIILSIPFSLNGANLSNEALFSFLIYPLSLIVFGGMLSISYLYIFNRITRQSLHDLAVGTYVVNTNVEKQEVGKLWNIHLIIVALLFTIAAIVPVFTSKLTQSKSFKEMFSLQAALLKEPEVLHATIFIGKMTFSSTNNETKTTNFVSSQSFLSSNKIRDTEFASRLATIVINNHPETRDKDSLRITLTYGYDIGIWSRWSHYTHNFNPREL